MIAHQYYKDPLLFWRIADANKAMLPDELIEEAGERILIPPVQR
jgi:nucleoid-associated protein YgaU